MTVFETRTNVVDHTFGRIGIGILFTFPLDEEDGDTDYGLYLKISDEQATVVNPVTTNVSAYDVGHVFYVAADTVVLPAQRVIVTY